MFQKILVALDESAESQQVLNRAIELAKASSASIMLCHVAPHFGEGYQASVVSAQSKILPGFDREAAIQSYVQQWEVVEQRGLDLLKGLSEQVSAQGIPTEFTQSIGDPGHAICNVANSWGADLIVIGHRGITGIKEFFLGSVSNYVLHHAPCAVLTIPLAA